MSYPDDPTCWSWPIPPLRNRDEEIRLTLELQYLLPPDDRLSENMIALDFEDLAEVQFLEFHTGIRASTPEGHEAVPRCAMCGEARLDRITEDHDHRTGMVRGWLCRTCNIAEGMGARAAIAGYRARHPAAILGYQRYYTGMHWKWGWWDDLERARRLTGNPDWEFVPEATP